MDNQTQTSTSKDKPIILKEIDTKERRRVSVIDREFAEGLELVEQYTKSVTVFGSARIPEQNKYYEMTRSVTGRIVKELGYTVMSGGGPGIMEAANRGAYEANGNSIGLTIELPHEQQANPYLTDRYDFHYFFSRKVALTFLAEAYIFAPGGFGTLNELFEILTLLQTKKIEAVPVILFGSDFWNQVNGVIKNTLLANGTIGEEDMKLYTITDDESEIIRIISSAPIKDKDE